MRFKLSVWTWLFLATVLGYCLYYAPFGINETDGGFLSGLAWQLKQGKTLYTEVIYVRPPVPVWLRRLFLEILPAQWPVLAERWLFYFNVAAYSLMGAAVLAQGEKRWKLAFFSFLLSVHNFPPEAWHTTDGIFFAVAGIYGFKSRKRLPAFAGGILLALGLLCKQSFYPLLFLPALFFFVPERRVLGYFLSGFFAGLLAVALVLYDQGALAWFFYWTSGSAGLRDAVQHGIFDYFRINPLAGIPALLLLLPVARYLNRPASTNPGLVILAWALSMFWLAGVWMWFTWQRQDFTSPFAQCRLLFSLALCYAGWAFWRGDWSRRTGLFWLALTGVNWCAAMSWGYNLPVLFMAPVVYVLMELSERLWSAAFPYRPRRYAALFAGLLLLILFRFEYEWVYRDGPRTAMTEPLGSIFPKLNGIYSSPETAGLYLDLKQLAARYPHFKTLPAFPLANYLTDTAPLLPMDWVVRRESNGHTLLLEAAAQSGQPVFFIEKAYAGKLDSDPELAFTHEIFKNTRLLEETPHFWVRSF